MSSYVSCVLLNHIERILSISSSVNFNCLKTLLQYTGSKVFFPIWTGAEYLRPSIVREYIAWSVGPCLMNTAPPFSSNFTSSLLDIEGTLGIRGNLVHLKWPQDQTFPWLFIPLWLCIPQKLNKLVNGNR